MLENKSEDISSLKSMEAQYLITGVPYSVIIVMGTFIKPQCCNTKSTHTSASTIYLRRCSLHAGTPCVAKCHQCYLSHLPNKSVSKLSSYHSKYWLQTECACDQTRILIVLCSTLPRCPLCLFFPHLLCPLFHELHPSLPLFPEQLWCLLFWSDYFPASRR